MIALEKWKLLKQEMEHAVGEGKVKGFDKDETTFENGCYFAYAYVLGLMDTYDNDSEDNK